MISFVFLLLLFAAGAAALGLVVFAIASKRLWIIPVAGGLVFLGLIALGLVGSVFFTARYHGAAVVAPLSSEFVEQVATISHTAAQAPPSFHVSSNGVNIPRPNWLRIPMFVLLITFVVGMIVRRGMSPACGHGFRRAWPVVALILLAVVMLLRTVRIQSSIAQPATVATFASGQSPQDVAARQRIVMAAQRADFKARMQQQTAQLDIQAEMDQFDAPRIELQPSKTSAKAPEAPAAATPPAAPQRPAAAVIPDNTPEAKTTEDDSNKPAAASNQRKRKKSDKSPSTSDAKQSQAVAQSKSATEAIAVEENTQSSDKQAAVAEAKPEKPKTRPAWVDESPKRTGNTHREVIATELYESVDECYQAADVYLLLKTYQRMQQLTGQPYTNGPLPSLTFNNGQVLADGQIIAYGHGKTYWADERIRNLIRMGIGIDYVRREVVAKDNKNNESREFVETVDLAFGPMKKLYLQIEFTPVIDRELRRHWDAHERRERFAMVGAGSFSILGLLGLVFALLKIDTATKGYYTKRLFIGVPLAILGMFGLYYMLVEMGVNLPH